ncbi:Tim44-like domain-containing protein [Thiobacillus sp.]|uniref:Tim44 domain-containing protein n=1 Tax=Thiobacillus sp. TaxID=924 RepID=UPI0011D80471|nr:Tim44-like domain-containing protein [Thiobacillus sp.]TXH72556.1 MAG: Tim44 domain-containing protein [Thiobacillus sp.]
MKRFLISLFALFISFSFVMEDAEARRLGGGKSFGMQRSAPAKQTATPAPQRSQETATPAPATPQKRSWMGPIAGLAAGLGLAALASHLGLGEEMANVLMLALLVMAAFMLVRFLMRRTVPAAPAMQYAGMPSSARNPAFPGFEQAPAAAFGESTRAFPPGFDAEAFVREAKLNFIRLQAAFDAGNLPDLRAFTTPEVFAEIRMQLAERGDAAQTTDVMTLDAEILEATDEDDRHVVSVRFTGMVREAADDHDATPLNEVWHLSKPALGQGGWVIAGIQQA